MLIQKRNSDKYHSGGLWANACCSHPRDGETLEEATHRRLLEEVGIDCELKELFHLYIAPSTGMICLNMNMTMFLWAITRERSHVIRKKLKRQNGLLFLILQQILWNIRKNMHPGF